MRWAQDCSIELTIGRRYGLLGSNGSGKSNFLQCLAAREARASTMAPASSNRSATSYAEKCVA